MRPWGRHGDDLAADDSQATLRNKPWKQPESFVLVVDPSGDAEKDAKTMEKAKKLASRVRFVSVVHTQT